MSTARLGELLGALSIATDLASAVPPETSMRTCLLATRLGRAMGVRGRALGEVFQVSLLRHLGCTAWSHEAAALTGGDDHDLLRAFEGVDHTRPLAVLGRAVTELGRGAGRVRAVTRVLAAPGAGGRLAEAQCVQASALAADLGLSEGVRAALGQIYERFDGRGHPRGAAGDDISTAARLLHVAQLMEIEHRRRGRDAALSVLSAGRGHQLDPDLVDVALDDADGFLALLEERSVWALFLDIEPEPRLTLDDDSLAEVALTFGRFADLKTPHTVGHSPAVAALAVDAARHLGLGDDEQRALKLAGLLHDIGAVSVANGVWEAPGALTVAQWEHVRLHSYWSERILTRSPITASLAPLVGAHHERLDGSGYYRGATALDPMSRVLAAADAFTAMREPRPHRPALTAAQARRELLAEVEAGRLCGEACAAVLAASGQAPPRRAARAGGLTPRETDVLSHLARGLGNKEIAAALGIGLRTVKHHVQNIYAKTGVSSRAGAALFAARHDLAAHRSADR